MMRDRGRRSCVARVPAALAAHRRSRRKARGLFPQALPSRHTAANFATEAIGTAMLLFGVPHRANAEGWAQAGEVDLSQVFSRALHRCSSASWCSALVCRSAGPRYAINPHAISGRASRTPFFRFQVKARPTGPTPVPHRRAHRRRHRRCSAVTASWDFSDGTLRRSARQGTTSTRFMVSMRRRRVARRQIEHAQIMPKPGWVGTRSGGNCRAHERRITGALRTAISKETTCRHRRHQPARDDDGVNPKNGRPWYNASSGRTRAPIASSRPSNRIATALPPHGVAARDVFLRHEAAVDSRERGGVRAAAENGEADSANVDTG